MLKVPAKYKRCGIKIKCLACKWQVANICRQNKKSLHLCPNKESHRFSLLICVPNNGGRRTRIIDTKDFSEALTELEKFKGELKRKRYHKADVVGKDPKKMTFMDYATAYLNTMSGENTPAIHIRKRSQDHIGDISRTFLRFGLALKKAGINYKILHLNDVTDNEVSIFHEYLLDVLKLKTRSYNKHIAAMRTFYNWAARVKDYKGANPFNHIELRQVASKEKSIISKTEFEKLLQVTTYENGFDKRKKNLFKDYLHFAYRLALETGLRREELITLRWSDIIPLEDDKLVFRISNLKVNRIIGGEDDGNYFKNVPITKSLMLLLLEMGYETKKEKIDFIIDRPDGTDMRYMMDLLSRSFAHFIKLVTDRKLEFKDLRKTYITHITVALGSNAKLFTGHTDDAVLKTHYLNGAFLAAKLGDFSVF
ncbi:MAG TPA: tyrosine-type recombinase/integrase [Flavipsychrobacter sp.]|nr:tyrosine-type recombinase/integrase [Flavipsychrobacter sp.]